MLSALSTSFIAKHHPWVGKHTYNLYHFPFYFALLSGQPRRTFDPIGPSRLATPLDFPFAIDFELSLLASHFKNILQWFYRYDLRLRSGGYRLYIVRSIIGFTRGRGTLECLARFPALAIIRFCVTICDTYCQRLLHEQCALERLFKDARTCESRSSKMSQVEKSDLCRTSQMRCTEPAVNYK